MPDDQNPDDGQDLETMFESWYSKRRDEEKRTADRNKDPKNFGEFLDKVSDAILDRAEQRGAGPS